MVTCYPVAGKKKAVAICQAFADGCGGQVVTDGVLRDGPAFFFGVDPSNEHIWKAVRADQRRDYYYGDNAYFDSCRGDYFRVTANRLQHSGTGPSDGKRFASLGIQIAPWRTGGQYVLLCPQSDQFMRVVAGMRGDWTRMTIEGVQNFTDQPLRVREWNRDKAKLAASLPEDLAEATALVTWSSAAAVTALLAGVPVCCTGPCAASVMGGDLADIDDLPRPERLLWAGVLADNQWTLDEMRSGKTWAALQ